MIHFIEFRTMARLIQNVVSNLNYSKRFRGQNYIFYSQISIRNNANSHKITTKERKFSENHTWIISEGKIGIVGLSNFAQQQMDEFVYVELPGVGRKCSMNEPCGILESIRAVIDLCSPASGVVYEKNTVEDFPKMINESCYDKGWLFKLELTKPNELNTLMNEAEYNDFVKKYEK